MTKIGTKGTHPLSVVKQMFRNG